MRTLRTLIVLTCLVGSTLLLVGHVAVAQAYLFWGYYQWSDEGWVFSSTGVEEGVPVDGAVEGWRFAAAGEDASRFPRADGDFDLLCGSTPTSEGHKRVGVVLDYGVVGAAPQEDAAVPAARGACAVVDQDATGAEVLAEVARIRMEGGLVCGIDGYPEQGCGEPTDAEPTSGPEPTVSLQLPETEAEAGSATPDDVVEREGPGGVTAVLIAGAALVVLIVLGGLLGRRRS